MASKKKQSEGIALLSMYNDNSDDEMEDAEEEDNVMREEEQDEAAEHVAEEDLAAETDKITVTDTANEVSGDGFTPTERSDLLDRTSSGTVQVLTPNNQANTPQFSETLKSDALNNDDEIRPDDAELEGEADQDENKPVDPLDTFLPPPPKVKCSEELQRKINKFLEYKRAGKSFNAEVRNRKDYRNPDFLLHAVRYQDIDQIGSCFSKDVFDPHGYDSSDFYDQIEADMRRESDRKEQEKKKAQNQKVDFTSGGTQPGIMLGAPRISMPVTGGSAASTGGLHLVPPAADSINRDGRQNKKSKWDKVDGDRKNPLPSVGQDSVSTAGSHAAILSAANAGGGYMQFAQQKRREAEERRSSERRLERRS
ncbi:hypothetical protein TSUD_38450 [Trifolium subterraneum]|uniref:SAP30-binding protein n=1 Tax=Trifolium subterraneum TaxID=3900 RepID=A0A2Z6MHZ5_TRISU|nr:hypothetical protein TSUD_38450 [Trifolium subterraneum]